jgi:hypothetical protein
MRFVTPGQWQSWCIGRKVPLRGVDWVRPAIDHAHFHCADLPYPTDSGEKVSLARRLFSLVASESETLVLVGEWDVWPSSRHLPLFTRFREALGEDRPLIEAPACIATPADSEDAVSVVVTSLLFIWDCYGISSTGRDAFYISHDEYCCFASRDVSVTQRVMAEFGAKRVPPV